MPLPGVELVVTAQHDDAAPGDTQGEEHLHHRGEMGTAGPNQSGQLGERSSIYELRNQQTIRYPVEQDCFRNRTPMFNAV